MKKLAKIVDKATMFIVILALVTSIGLLVRACAGHKKTVEVETEQHVYIVCTDEDGELYASEKPEDVTYKRVYYPLTMDEREWIAEILAGKAADRTESCMRLVATVIYNEITECDGDIVQAVKKYGLTDSGTPTDTIYKVVDDVFYNGELMLDDDVLWFNNTGSNSAFHDSLVFVTDCDGISFYKQHYSNIEVI